MFGFYGRILIIDLDNHSFLIESVHKDIFAKYLGGKGLATHLLLHSNPKGVDPLSPENHLIFATGPFCQSPLWGSSRYGVYTKSPLTGFYAESYSGGRIPEAMDSAGFDAVVIRGMADNPTVVTITPDGAKFFDATDIWGQDCYTSEKEALTRYAIKKEGYHKPGAVVIGPAAENLVRFALIANDKWRCAGRTGVGTVLGAKKVKAVVFQGDRKRKLADTTGASEYAKIFSKTYIHSPAAKAYRSFGTTMMVALMNTIKAFPAKYWRQGTCEHWEMISGETFHKEHQIKPHACARCFLACGRKARIIKGRHKDLVIEGPEYETIYAFGGLCMVREMDEVAYLNDLCDRLGMDTITTGNLCALLMEAKEKGKINYDIEYGQTDKIAALIQQIAHRKGIGNILADGIIKAAAHLGLEEIAIHVKGLEPAGYDPRVLKGMGLAFATSARGACHLRTTFYKAELTGLIPPEQIEGKAEMLIDYEDRLNIFDCLILCRFYRDMYPWEELEKTICMVTGLSLSVKEIREMAIAVLNLTRRFNINEGLKPEDDRLPDRMHQEPLPSGHTLKAEDMKIMLQDYYRLRGWGPVGIQEE